ncbi:MAG TPA: hypothetical protein PLI09_16505 [Candidatus Hydrogenedentes bacterium]|nr:hypothetical protein [Candidatus Hydrogenedentota bacterium]
MVTTLLLCLMSGSPEDVPFVPIIDGPWWTVAHKPTLPEAYQDEKQQPVSE